MVGIRNFEVFIKGVSPTKSSVIFRFSFSFFSVQTYFTEEVQLLNPKETKIFKEVWGGALNSMGVPIANSHGNL